MSARGMGLRSPKLPSLLATRTADMGEKYRRVLVMTPSRGMSDAMRGFDVISREVPPPRIRDSSPILLLIGSNLLARGRSRVGWLPFRKIGLDLGIQACDGIKMPIGPNESTSSRRVDFICRPMRGTADCLRVKISRSRMRVVMVPTLEIYYGASTDNVPLLVHDVRSVTSSSQPA